MEQQTAPKPLITDDSYLLRLKRKGKSNEFISAKMGIPLEEVDERWRAIVKMQVLKEENGLSELRTVCAVLQNQFQLLGQSLGIFTNALHDTYEPSELRKIIEACPKGTDLGTYLMKHTIILKPFFLPSPAELAAEAENSPVKK